MLVEMEGYGRDGEEITGAAFYDFSITKAVACLFITSALVLLIFISIATSEMIQF